jgi:hypothetical protein
MLAWRNHANAPLIEACEHQTAADTLILTRRAHPTAAISLDDRLVTGGTTGAAAIDGFHGIDAGNEDRAGGGIFRHGQSKCNQQSKFADATALL